MAFEIKNQREEAILYFALVAKRNEYEETGQKEAANAVDDMVARLLEAWMIEEAAPKAAMPEQIGY